MFNAAQQHSVFKPALQNSMFNQYSMFKQYTMFNKYSMFTQLLNSIACILQCRNIVSGMLLVNAAWDTDDALPTSACRRSKVSVEVLCKGPNKRTDSGQWYMLRAFGMPHLDLPAPVQAAPLSVPWPLL